MTEFTPEIAESASQIGGAAEPAAAFSTDAVAPATLGATDAGVAELASHDRPDDAPAADPNVAQSPQRLADRILRYRDLNDGLELLPPYARSLLKIKVPIIVTLAETKQAVGKILELVPGAIIQFNKSCDEMLTLEAGGQAVALGEAVKVGDKFGLRVTSIKLPDERFAPVRGPRAASA